MNEWQCTNNDLSKSWISEKVEQQFRIIYYSILSSLLFRHLVSQIHKPSSHGPAVFNHLGLILLELWSVCHLQSNCKTCNSMIVRTSLKTLQQQKRSQSLQECISGLCNGRDCIGPNKPNVSALSNKNSKIIYQEPKQSRESMDEQANESPISFTHLK